MYEHKRGSHLLHRMARLRNGDVRPLPRSIQAKHRNLRLPELPRRMVACARGEDVIFFGDDVVQIPEFFKDRLAIEIEDKTSSGQKGAMHIPEDCREIVEAHHVVQAFENGEYKFERLGGLESPGVLKQKLRPRSIFARVSQHLP